MLSVMKGGNSVDALPRAATAGMIMFSIGYIVLTDEIRTSIVWPLLVDGLYLVLLAAFVMRAKASLDTERHIMFASVVLWAIFLAFFVPVSSPALVLSVCLVLLSSMYMEHLEVYAATLLLVLGTEAGYILSDDYSASNLNFMVVHIVSLVLTAVAANWLESSVRQQSQMQMEESEQVGIERERLQALINSMTDGVLALDNDGKVAVYNGSALDILNINASLEDQLVTDFMNVQDMEGNEVNVLEEAKKRQGYLVSRDYLLAIDEYENMNLYVSMSPVKIGFGHQNDEGYILLLRDITREKSLEEERDEFISVVSHELRTPITIAEGNISNAELIAEKEKLPKGVNDSLDAAHKQVVFLSDMINDLSTLSRAERGKLKEAPEDIDIHELVKSLQRDYRTQAQQKSIEFKTHVDKEVSTIYSSRLYVREILQNFITNAIKYTQEGDVELSVRQKGGKVEFSVRDSGIGISKSDQKHLFKKFFRSEDYRTRENNGTGLGLYVTMKLAKLISAQIGVKSELNKGSTFIVTVPSMKGHKVDVA